MRRRKRRREEVQREREGGGGETSARRLVLRDRGNVKLAHAHMPLSDTLRKNGETRLRSSFQFQARLF